MKLLRLELTAFKGIKHFVFEPGGVDASVYADNGVGKTTLCDAYNWLLFDKDSLGQSKFDIKTLDADGKAKSGIEHCAEAVFDLGGEKLILGKVYKEVWTKPRGKSAATFGGHTTDYYINHVPVSESEYQTRVTSICSLQLLRTLSDVAYFPSVMKWQDRRQVLMDFSGDISDADVCNSSDALQFLPAILGSYSLEEYRKILTGRRIKVNEAISTLPTRIDEANRNMPEEPQPGIAMEQLEADMKALVERRAEVNSGGEIAKLSVRHAEIEAELLALANKRQSETNNQSAGILEQARTVMAEASDQESTLRNIRTQIEDLQRTITGRDALIQSLRRQFNEEKAKEFNGSVTDTCAACGQSLPVEKVQAALEAARASFNEARSQTLETIQTDGKALKSRQDADTASLDALLAQVPVLEGSITALNAKASSLNDQAKASTPAEIVSDPERVKLLTERSAVDEQMSVLRGSASNSLKVIDDQIAAVASAIKAAQQVEANKTLRATLLARIAELETSEIALSQEFDQIEQEWYLTEEFIRTKVRMLEDKVNSRFTFVRFRLFREQVNGGLEERCDLTVNGVPYDSLNHGMRINAGLDVIEALSKHYGFAPPIWIDGAESITALQPTTGQQIRLVVSAADKTLRPETGSRQLQEALI